MKLASARSGRFAWPFALAVSVAAGTANAQRGDPPPAPDEGALAALNAAGQPLGPCPLETTKVDARVSGMFARVSVTQVFRNPYEDKIEAVYTFPLSHTAAVSDMTIRVGDRVVRGEIKERSEAERIYAAARSAGHVAALLDQERPNIFTQSVANIEPGATIEVSIAYVETMDWREGSFRWSFPTVVGPRYIPGSPAGAKGPGWAPPTDQVPDASRITPPVAPEDTRAGHNIEIAVRIDAGERIGAIRSEQHEIEIERDDDQPGVALVSLKRQDEIPNRDFVLSFTTASQSISDALVAQREAAAGGDGYFTLVLQPPARVEEAAIRPRELIFVIDSSGSMSGFPIDTARIAMRRAIRDLRDDDTFNLITFAGRTSFCFAQPAPATRENRQRALAYLDSLQGGGGTEMMRAIEACLSGAPLLGEDVRHSTLQEDPLVSPERTRIVCFMTDGYVGNDLAIIDAVKKNAGEARVFSFGIGTSVNRYLLDEMAKAGRGEVEYVLGPAQAQAAAERFRRRIRNPVLTDVALDFGDLPVADVFPRALPDLFDTTPVVVVGRYTKPAKGAITLRGVTGRGAFERTIEVNLPDATENNRSIDAAWARRKVDAILEPHLTDLQRGSVDDGVKQQVVALGLAHRLLTPFTSFVAVEEMRITEGGEPRTIAVPVDMPAGVSHEGVFGEQIGNGVMQLRRVAARSSSSFAAEQAPTSPMPIYNFQAAPGQAQDALRVDREQMLKSLSPENRRAFLVNERLAPALRSLAKRMEGVAPDEHGEVVVDGVRVRKGAVEVIVLARDLSDEFVEKAKALGFEVVARFNASGALVGRIDVKKLDDLALLEGVRSVTPATP